MKEIPISSAKAIAELYGYDQVVIVARKVGKNGGEHCTTYGVNKANCDVAARIGDFFKFKLMGWKPPAAKPNKKPILSPSCEDCDTEEKCHGLGSGCAPDSTKCEHRKREANSVGEWCITCEHVFWGKKPDSTKEQG